MCDTLVATADVTVEKVTLFAKNSDREPNEAQQIVLVPAQTYPPNSLLKCTYRQIPQAAKTHAVLLSKPFWMWGAEMGVNEHGVAIGNEAVFSKVPANKAAGLIGMDFVRLGLERASTAREAVQVITELLEEFGQSGNGGFTQKFYYHNSYLLADAHEAWVLETVDKHWAAKQVTGFYAISNRLTIGKSFDLSSSELVEFALQKGWCKNRQSFHFTRSFSDRFYTFFSASGGRRQRFMQKLSEDSGQISLATLRALLRDHFVGHQERSPAAGFTSASICMHASFGPVRAYQTTGSLIAYLHPRRPICFLTGTAAPCTSLFKPIWLDTALPKTVGTADAVFDANALFWRHEQLHRLTLRDYENCIQIYQAERDELETEFVENALQMMDATQPARRKLVNDCFARADEAEMQWLQRLKSQKAQKLRKWFYSKAWDRFNKKAEMTFL